MSDQTLFKAIKFFAWAIVAVMFLALHVQARCIDDLYARINKLENSSSVEK